SNGNVIAIGGQFGNFYGSMTSEIYDVATGTWSKADSMNRVRYGHRAVVLNNGKILIAGGLPSTNTTEIYDPIANSWTYTGNMNVIRNEGLSLTLLNNGKVLAAGGNNTGALNTAELYDPSTGVWTSISSNMYGKRYNHSAILLNNGKVLLAGSSDLSNGDDKTAELYDPVTNTFSPTGNLQQSRINNATIKMNNGDVLIYGWGDYTNPSNTKCIEVYNVATGTWSTSQMYNIMGTIGYSINKLPNNKILVAGGLAFSSTATNVSKLINDNTVSGIVNEFDYANIDVYPNPTNDFIYIEGLKMNNNKLLFKLFDNTGKEIISNYLTQDLNFINIKALPKGLYYYHIFDNEQFIKAGKIIILN
ncbi:MAG TPA: T9SS type A sorting domain-containing protein, partial [Bacteroidales bacterium]|nr:T9SS type A sorting domain-containing protein [Bacteroidales bacterium]